MHLARIICCFHEAHILWTDTCTRSSPGVHLSVHPSACHTFFTIFLPSYHHESYHHWQKWCPRKRWRSEVKGQGHRGQTQLSRFRTKIPVWIHIWWWNDAQNLMWHTRGALLFFKVIRQTSWSHGEKIADFDPNWAFLDHYSSLNPQMATQWCTKLEAT